MEEIACFFLLEIEIYDCSPINVKSKISILWLLFDIDKISHFKPLKYFPIIVHYYKQKNHKIKENKS